MTNAGFNTLKGSLNLITGCGSGLGRATLIRFLKQGSGPILAVDRKFNDGFLDDSGLSDEERARIVLKTHDTFDEKVEVSISEFVKNHGHFDNVINVAGIALAFMLYPNKTRPDSVYKLEHANNLLQFNTVGTFNMIRLAAKYMINYSVNSKDNPRSRCIVNTSCLSTTRPSIGQTFYTGSKAAIDSMTLCIAREFGPFNIRCNTINVGYFDTPLIRSADVNVCNYLASEVSLCPKKIGHPDEFAHLVEKIVENQMINGTCIRIDAGADWAN